MTPEQVLAINAGLSPDVAKIFAERARTDSMGAEKQQDLLREMLELSKSNHAGSDEQARFFFEKGVEGMAAVSQGKNVSQSGSATTGSGETGMVECPKCHHTNVKASDRFCHICGHKMRT